MMWSNLILIPAVMFWLSTVLAIALGNDYYYDMIFFPIGVNPLGNILLISLVVGLPAAAVPLNGMKFLMTKRKGYIAGLAGSILLLAMGFFAVMTKG